MKTAKALAEGAPLAQIFLKECLGACKSFFVRCSLLANLRFCDTILRSVW
jgi:hypothetical protein